MLNVPAKPTWSPSPVQLQNKANDERDIQMMVDYRSKFMPQWERAIRAWNLLAEPVDDPDVSNVLFPLARMLCTAGLTAMSKGRPGFGIRPGGPSDFKKVDLIWKPAIESVLSECNYDNQQDFFLTDWEVTGNGVFEVYSQLPTRTSRVEKPDGTFDEIVRRDFTRPKLGVRYRTPYECGISPYARTPEEAPSCYFQEAMSEAEFNQNYKNCKLPDGRLKYMNCEHVCAGKIVTADGDGNLLFRESEYKGVIVVVYQNQLLDVYRIYANGVLIFDKPLKRDRLTNKGGANVLGLTTLCWGANWHQYDPNLRTHSLYGMGDPHLIRGLDILYQAFSNMTVDNMRLANTVPVSFKSFDGVPGSNDEISISQMYSGYVLKNGGEIISSPLGQVSLNNYGWYREFLEEMSIWLGRNNFKQMVGDTSATAYELFQKEQANNEGFAYRLKKLENGCFKKMGRLILAGVMSDLTVEDFEELTEQEVSDVIEKIGRNEASSEDYADLLSKDPNKRPKRKIHYHIRTPGKVYSEKPSKDGKYGLDSLRMEDRYKGQDGYIKARSQYVVSQEYAERGGIPDLYCETKSMLGDNQNVKMAKVKLLAEYARARKAEGLNAKELASRFDLEKIDTLMVQVLEMPEDEVMEKNDPNAEMNAEIDAILDELSASMRPVSLSSQSDVQAAGQSPAQNVAVPRPVPTPDLEGFDPFSGSSGKPRTPVRAATGGPA